MNDNLNNKDPYFDKILKDIIEDKGGTEADYKRLMNGIAYHESAGTLDPTIHQYGGGPGRGKYQFEGQGGSNRILSAANRTKKYLRSKGHAVPDYISKIIKNGTGDASTLTSAQQDVLFLGDLRMKGGVDLKDYVTGDLSIQDLWADHWWAGSKEKRAGHIKSFNNSLNKFKKKFNTPQEPVKINVSGMKVPDERMMAAPKQDNLDLSKYMNRKFINQEDSKLNSFNTGGRHEQNPLGGIPQGMGGNGKPNTVEQGESSYDFPEGKFIFSDRVFINQKDTKLKPTKNNEFALGGNLNPNCGGEGQPPCKERLMETGKTANTWGNMFGNVGQYFFGMKDEDLKESPYKPTIKSYVNPGDKEPKYYTRPGMREDVYNDLTSDRVKKDYNHDGSFNDIFKGLKSNGEDRKHNADQAFPKNKAGYKGQYNKGHGSFKGEFNLGRYRTDAGEDEKGRYISFVDTYDWNGFNTDNKIPFYDRIYEKDWSTYSEKVKLEKLKKIKKQKDKIKRISGFVKGSKI